MKRLLWKEFRSSLWYVLFACAIVTVMTFTGDPLFFRGIDYSTSVVCLIVVFFLMGLRAYSTELADDTPRFLYSRPIRWWHVFAAKLISGLSGILLTLVVGGIVYAMTTPDSYRPFLLSELASGAWFGLLVFGGAFAAGYVVSILLPGIALSFAAFVVVALGIISPEWMLSEYFRSIMGTGLSFVTPYAELFGIAGTLIGALFVARKLSSLSARERLILWVRFPVAAMFLGAIVGYMVLVNSHPALTSVTPETLSPNGAWILDIVQPTESHAESILLKSMKDGRKIRIPLDAGCKYTSWSSDSLKLALLTSNSRLYVIKPDSHGEQPIKVRFDGFQKISEPDRSDSDVYTVEWNADSSEIAAVQSVRVKSGEDRLRVAVVDVNNGKTRYIEHPVSTSLADAMFRPATEPVIIKEANMGLFWPRGLHRSE